MKEQLLKFLQPGLKNLMGIYILLLIGTINSVFLIVGGVLAFANQDNGNMMSGSHYNFLLRTSGLALLIIIVSNVTKIILIGFLLHMALSVWLIVRLIFGLKYLMANKSHPNPLTYWII